MYQNFYGFREKPFSLLPDSGFLYLSGKHRMALTLLEYGLMNQAGFTVISGEIGTGKTTLIRQLLNNLDPQIKVGLISNTHQTFGDLMQWIALAFDLPHAGKDKVQLFHDFMDFIIREYAQGRRTVLIVDEAQNMSAETLEELRMLSNVNADKDQVLQVILVGQKELRETLRRPDLVQFAQRIAVDYHLEPLNEEETSDYIRHRCTVAGGKTDLFSDQACQAVFEFTAGVPRLINLLCDTALVYGYAEQRERIDAKLVRDVGRDKQKGGLFPTPQAPVSQVAATDPVESAGEVNPPAAQAETAPPAPETPDYPETPVLHQAPEPVPAPTTEDDPAIVPSPVTHHEVPEPEPAPTTTDDTAFARPPIDMIDAQGQQDPVPTATVTPLEPAGNDNALLRIAIATESAFLRAELPEILARFGIQVVTTVRLNVTDLGRLDDKDLDVLLVGLDDHIDSLDEVVYRLFEKWDKPILFSDSLDTEADLLQAGNPDVGRKLSQKLFSLAPQAPQSVA